MSHSAELPLTESDCADLALVLRTPDPLDDHPEVQQRWIALMRKYPGKNALDMAADFLEHLTSAKDCCYNTHADDCPNGIGENGIKQPKDSPPTIDAKAFEAACRALAASDLRSRHAPSEQEYSDEQFATIVERGWDEWSDDAEACIRAYLSSAKQAYREI